MASLSCAAPSPLFLFFSPAPSPLFLFFSPASPTPHQLLSHLTNSSPISLFLPSHQLLSHLTFSPPLPPLHSPSFPPSEHFLRSPDGEARRALALLGEAASLQILSHIAASRKISNLSGFIIFMARNSTVAMARNAEALSTCASVCFSGSSSPELSCLKDGSLHHEVAPMATATATGSPISVMNRIDMASPADGVGGREIASPEMEQMELESTMRGRASPQMLALGELEFRRAFLILSYLGR